MSAASMEISRPTISTKIKTHNGTATYYNRVDDAVAALGSTYFPAPVDDDSMKDAAAPPPPPPPVDKALKIIESVSTAASFTGAAATAASTGVSLTQYLSGYYASEGSATVPPALEIEITNNSSKPLVLFNYSAYQAEVSKASQSLFPGESDIVLVTRNKAFSDQDSSASLFFLIDGISVAVIYNWSASKGLWLVDACIDPAFTNHKLNSGQVNGFPASQQLVGAGFVDNSSNPLFSFFTSTINTPSGQIELDFFNHSSVELFPITSGGRVTSLGGMEKTGQQLASDMQAIIDAETESRDDIDPVTILAGIGALANVVGAAANVGSFGVSLASLVSDSDSAASGNQKGVGLEIEITNHMKLPLVLATTALLQESKPSTPQGGVTNGVLSIAPGVSEVVLVTNGFFNPNDSNILLELAVCIPTSEGDIQGVTCIPVGVTYEWVTHTFTNPKNSSESVDDKRWQASFEIDNNAVNFSPYLQLVGATYTAPANTNYPNFSVYTTPTSTQSGQIDLMFYDTAQS